MTGNIGVPFTGFSPEDRERISLIISDVDDTITQNGKLMPQALKALWDLKTAGKTIVLVTGGSTGWADAYLRQWPVDAVIAESGALMVCYSRDHEVIHIVNPVINKEEVAKKRLALMARTNGLAYSSDQVARVFDIAYEKKKLDPIEVKILKRTLESFGASYAESSIHINAWFGDYDKRKALKFFLEGPLEMKEEFYLQHGVYFGDSFNDQPLFSYIPTSVGMHTVEENRDGFQYLPTYITEGGPGEGFCQAVASLLAK